MTGDKFGSVSATDITIQFAGYKFKSVSVTEIARQLAQKGISPEEAVEKAKEEFPKQLSKLLEQGWEILIGDSTKVYLRRRREKERRRIRIGREERKLLKEMFEKLEKATDGFTKEGGLYLVYPRFPAPSQAIIVMPYESFKGFSVSPEEYIQEEIKKKYPDAKGTVVFYLMENYFAYVSD